MFNSSKIGDSSRVNKNNLNTILNESANGIPRSFLQPKITSTPLVRRENAFATPPKQNILSPRRYSLSEIATPPRTNRKEPSKMHPAGPLLASTRYNLNVSTYEDTKSPGLAGRIVKYNEEVQKEKERQRPPTHQAKYGSPGIFPIVHLFKKTLPPLEQKPRTVTIRIASPEYSRRHTQEYNRKLLEGIITPNSPNTNRHVFASPSGEGNNSSTRSVLEALKEISRKRIHANEEYELNEDNGKRLRTESQFNEVDSNKRLRDDSPLLETSSSPNKSNSKRICMYDEYAASCSSMNFSLKKSDQSGPKRKSISISTITENPKESKQVKLINAETQTVPSETDKKSQSKEATTETLEETSDDQTDDKQLKKKESPAKIFDDAPLERIRKNRLAALMGSLAGKDPLLAPKPDYESTLNSNNTDVPDAAASEVSKASEKPLISILSSPKKDASPHRSNKHVHFNIPESTSQPNFTTSPIPTFSITRSSASITSPISSTCEAKTSFGSNKSQETPAPPSSPIGVTPSTSATTVVAPILTFGSGSNSSSATSVVSKESSSSLLNTSISKSDTAVPNYQFTFPTASKQLGGAISSVTFSTSTVTSQMSFGSPAAAPFSTAAAPTSTATSPPKMGGFKFDLAKPATPTTLPSSTNITSATVSPAPTFSFGSNAQTDSNKTKSFLGNISSSSGSATTQSSSMSTPTGFSFGVKSSSGFSSPATNTTTAISSNNTFGTTTTASASFTTPASNIPSIPTFKFGAANTENKPAASGFGIPNTGGVNFGSTSTPSSIPAFGASTTASSTPATSAPAFGTSKAPVFAFGPPTTSSTTSSFGTATTSAPLSLSFGTPVTTSISSGFGVPSTGGFGTSNTAQPSTAFGVSTTSSAIGAFGTSTTTSGGFGTSTSGGFGTTTSGGFGTSTSGGFGASSTAPMFGNNKAVSPFGVTTTSAPTPFGTAPASNPPPFGKNTTSTFGQSTTQPSFGAPTATASFGTTNTFAGTTTTSSSVFGGSVNTSSAFGKPLATGNIFGGVANTQPSGFGTTTSKPLFGDASAPSPFGTSAPATTAPSFGSTTTPTFNFGAKTTASNAFGSTFGTTTTTTGSTGFGTSTTPAFGTSNSFGSGSSSFGTSNAFGGSATPSFGAVTTTSQPTGFGTSNTAPAFGNASTGFGASNKAPIFGASTTPAFGATSAATPTFGTTAPTSGFGTPNNSTGFGANTAASAFAKPQSGFGATPNNTFGGVTGFGSNQAPASGFGSTNPPSTQTPVFSFGASAPSKPTGVFSFGAASAGGEPPKPTFNFSGGNSAPAFGSSGTPAFGSTGTPSFGAAAVPQFAPQPAPAGMFSIGSGSSTGRTRTQLRAKRRT